MPLQKVIFKPGVNRENTRYTNEGGWYESDKIRFRQGTPEVIGGWVRISASTFDGVCRSLWNWITYGGSNLMGVGTNTKFYIENGGGYNDITPIRATVTLGANPFALNGTTTVTVTAAAHGVTTGTFVTFSGATTIGGGGTNVTAAVLNQEFQLTVVDANSYSIVISVVPNATAIAGSPGGGSAVAAAYQLNAGSEYQLPLTGWGAGPWGSGPWGTGTAGTTSLQLWNQINYGQDLLYGLRGGGIYYWNANTTLTTRGTLLSSLGGSVTFTNASPTVVTATTVFTEGAALQFAATTSLPTGVVANTTYYATSVSGLTFNIANSAGTLINTTSTGTGVYISNIVDVPSSVNTFTVSDTSRFIITFGCNDYGSTTLNPMLIRWSNQDDPYNWTPNATNQAGSVQISHGSQIITTVQTRQEVIVFSDSAVYSLQYLGPPYVWGSQLLGDNISIVGPNAAVIASGIVYWMGVDKFYMYDGRVQTLNCDLRRYVFNDFNQQQSQQVFCSTNEGFNEVWWFYCSANSNQIDRYVIYNYLEKVWYYGTMARTAWIDSGLRPYPVAATLVNNLVNHENGINDNITATTSPINAYISSAQFDIGDGHNFGFVWRMLPDITFAGSSNSPANATAQVTMTLQGLVNSGSGITSSAGAPVASSSTYLINNDTFTGQIYTRLRGRQMQFRIESNQVNTAWQLGAPRIDVRQDGRR